ncbi:MAG: ThiF family adenylyltransferase [Chitinophagaceae bacterium]
MLHYYSAHTKLPFIGEAGQHKLTTARVLVVGAGGLGCPCLQLLAGAGVGTIGIADFDVVEMSNLQRQLLFSEMDIGRKKAVVAKEVLRNRNPAVQIVVHDVFVEKNNVQALLSAYDIVVDATDNFAVRYLLNDTCVVLNKPWVYGAIHREEGHCAVFNLKGSATLRDLFVEPARDAVPSCAVIGAYNITTALVGTVMANEVIKIILEREDVLVNKLLLLDALGVQFRTMQFSGTPENRALALEKFRGDAGKTAIEFAMLQEMMSKGKVRLVDVRTVEERAAFSLGGEHILLEDCLAGNHTLLPSETIVFYCASGIRSANAVKAFKEKNYPSVYSLMGGARKVQADLP